MEWAVPLFPVFLSRVCVPPFFSARVSPLFLFSILYPSASRPENVPSRAAKPRCVFSPVGSLTDLSLISSVGIYLPSNSPTLTRFTSIKCITCENILELTPTLHTTSMTEIPLVYVSFLFHSATNTFQLFSSLHISPTHTHPPPSSPHAHFTGLLSTTFTCTKFHKN